MTGTESDLARKVTSMTINVSAEQQLHFLERDVLPLIEAVCSGYNYNPGSSDLDDEQPIYVSMTLGEYRRASRLLYELKKVDG